MINYTLHRFSSLLIAVSCMLNVACFSHAQNEKITPSAFSHRNGFVHYYVWEENEQGNIIDSTFSHSFSMNRLVLLDSSHANQPEIDTKNLIHILRKIGFLNAPKRKLTKSLGFHFIDFIADTNTTVVYRKQHGKWHSFQTQAVLYFEKTTAGLAFKNSSNTLKFKHLSQFINQNSYYVVSEESDSQENQNVYLFTGLNLTNQLNQKLSPTPKRYLIFANGYRGPATDKNESLNEILMTDRTYYWYNIDNRFIERLHPDTSFYIDGSFSVKTSNYRSKIKFGWRYLRAQVFSSKNSTNLKPLKLKSNVEGFMRRYLNGKIAGKAFLNTIQTSPIKIQKDSVDFVCHSMGYAYMMGFIDEIKDQVVLRKLYLVSPENASVYGVDWSMFQEVWQYGSNFDQAHPDLLRKQDGIAPQVAAKGLPETGHSGRVFIPEYWPNKHFVHGHMIYGFDWIFDRIEPNQKGYIHR